MSVLSWLSFIFIRIPIVNQCLSDLPFLDYVSFALCLHCLSVYPPHFKTYHYAYLQRLETNSGFEAVNNDSKSCMYYATVMFCPQAPEGEVFRVEVSMGPNIDLRYKPFNW